MEALFVAMSEKIFSWYLFLTHKAVNLLVWTEVGGHLLQRTLEGAASDLARACNVGEAGDESPRQVAGVVTNGTSADWARLVMINLQITKSVSDRNKFVQAVLADVS